MVSIKELAKAYEPQQTKNIAELKKIPVDIEVEEKEFTNKEDGKQFKILVFTLDDEEYRMPKTVLKQLKEQIEANEGLEFFKVSKKGDGLKTEYTVIPLL